MLITALKKTWNLLKGIQIRMEVLETQNILLNSGKAKIMVISKWQEEDSVKIKNVSSEHVHYTENILATSIDIRQRLLLCIHVLYKIQHKPRKRIF